MKILWIAKTCPYPKTDGEKIRVYNLLKYLSKNHDLTLVCRVMDDEEKEGIANLKTFCTSVHAAFVPRASGFFEKVRWCFPFILSRYPISMSTVYFKEVEQILRQLNINEKFDIIQVEHSSLTIYLDHVSFSGNPLKVVTMHNIDYIRNKRIVENLRLGFRKIYYLYNQIKFKKWELSSLFCYDAIIVMSKLDHDILKNDIKSVPIYIVPNGVNTDDIKFEPTFNKSKNLIFVASMDSESNHDAAIFFINEIFPQVKIKFPSLRVLMVGRNPKPELVAYHNGKDIIVTGKVENVFDYYRKAVLSIVPLRSGGGTRLKILEAMATGVPVVTTSIGCEGLNVQNGENILIADHPDEFVSAIQRLMNDCLFRQDLVRKARFLVDTEYNWQLIAETHDEVYQSIARENNG